MTDSGGRTLAKLGSQKLRLLERAAEDKTLTESDLRILIKCASWTGPKGSFSKSVSDIAKACGVDRSTVIRSLARLGEQGLIERIGRHNDIGNAANEYRLCFTPQKAVQAIAREARRSQRDKKRAPKNRAGGRTDATSGVAPMHPLGSQGCDTIYPYPSPSSSLNANGASRSANGGGGSHVGLSGARNIGDVLSKSFPGTADETHSGNDNRIGLNRDTEKSKNTNRLLEAQLAFLQKSGCGVHALRKIEVREKISFKPVEDQIAFWQERAVR